jgi:DNA uptake protein ComE-like DNA-binding protein
MKEHGGARAASLSEVVLIVCMAALFCGAAAQELEVRASAAQTQAVAAAGQAVQSSAQAAHQQSVAEKIAASKELLDINMATAEQLKALPGMGEAYAARVIAGRPYTAKNQLATRGILPKDEYEGIRELIIAHRPKR